MWKKNMNAREVAELVERFLERRGLYPQEWNDFVDTSQKDKKVDAYRKRFYELDPLVNRPGDPDPQALAEMRSLLEELRACGA